MSTTSYRVEGMTCAHCMQSVSTEVGALPGVRSVDVDLATAVMTVTSDAEVDREAVRVAVDQAGYELAG